MDVYAAVDAIVSGDGDSVSETCRILKINRTAFYAWKMAAPTVSEQHDDELAPFVNMIFRRHKRRYGARRIAEELKSLGHNCDRRRVSRVMKTLKLKAIQPKSFVPKTTDSRHRLGYSPNLLLDAQRLTSVNRLWVGDITYLPLAAGDFCYMAMLMDRFSRRIVGWKIDDNMTESLVLAAVRPAIRNRRPDKKLIHHTDRGGQYAGHEYRRVLRRHQIQQSMSRAANCYDNAFMESCFGTIKTELQLTEYSNRQAAVREMAEYVQYYTFERRHSALDYLTPAQFEQLNKRSE